MNKINPNGVKELDPNESVSFSQRFRQIFYKVELRFDDLKTDVSGNKKL